MSNGLVFLGNYAVRDDGTVIGPRGHALKPEVIRGGYHRVMVNGRRQLVHVLVAQCHIGPRPSGYEVNHRDGDKANNRVTNLEYVTPKENVRHSLDELGVKRACGARCRTAVLFRRECGRTPKTLRERRKRVSACKSIRHQQVGRLESRDETDMETHQMSNGLQFLDFFAGFGGSSSGLVEAGYELVSAFNHWDKAIAVHSANHRRADHVQGDLSGYDMRMLPKNANVLWASPECTWHSPAGGRRRVRADQPDLFGEHQLPADAGVRSRATMFDPIRAAEARGFDVVMIENVPEVADWPLFPAWLRMWEDLGYRWQIVNVSAAHVYSESNAPAGQWRDRIYIVLSKRGIRMPRIEPRPPAWCDQCQGVVEAVQSWKKHRPIQVGKYGPQYVYVCGANQHPRQVVEPFVLPAAAVIDWSDLGERIGDRKRKLAAATMRRIEVGARMFARPAVVAHSGQTWDAANQDHRAFGDPHGYYRVWAADGAPLMTRQAGGSGDALSIPPFYTAVNHDADDRARALHDGPLPTRSTKIGDGLVFPPFLSNHYGGDLQTNRNQSPDDAPMPTVVGTRVTSLIVPPYITELYGTSTARSVQEALSTVTAGGNHHGVAVPPGAFLSRQYTQKGSDANVNTSVWEPTHAITGSGGNHALVVPQRKRPDSMFEGDLPFELDDVRFRMLGPTEHLRAQRFWEGYDTSAANKSETTKGAGNAVAVNVAHWIGTEVAAALHAA